MDLEALKIDRRRRPRRSGPRWALRLLGAAALVAVAWLAWRPLRNAVDRVRLPTVRVAAVVEASPVRAAAFRGTAANGHVVAARRAALSTDIPGRIVELNVTEGSVVRAGDVVARLFADDYAAAAARARADVAAASAAVARARAAADAADATLRRARRDAEAAAARLGEARAAARLAEADLGRTERLVEDAVLAERELDAARATAQVAAARSDAAAAELAAARSAVDDASARKRLTSSDWELARAQAAAAEAAAEEARAVLEKTVVRAPFDGVVVLKDAEVGEVVSPNSQGGSNARGSVCTVADFRSLEIQAEVPETSLGGVALDAPVTVFLDAHPDEPYGGRVSRIWPTADRQKATIEVRAVLDSPDDRLRPDMGVRIVFTRPGATASPSEPTPSVAPSLVVPEAAVVRLDGRTGVMVVERDRARFTAVTLGEAHGGRVTIREGLAPGQRVVVSPPPTLGDGDRVLIEES